jgi:hypothetical protein
MSDQSIDRPASAANQIARIPSASELPDAVYRAVRENRKENIGAVTKRMHVLADRLVAMSFTRWR